MVGFLKPKKNPKNYGKRFLSKSITIIGFALRGRDYGMMGLLHLVHLTHCLV
jgi:hypothetical protein